MFKDLKNMFQYVKYNFLKKYKGKRYAKLNYLKKYLKPVTKIVDNEMETIPVSEQNISTDKIWTMWLQEDIPELIQVCLNTIRKFYPDMVVITEKNLFDYVEIPEYIMEKYRKGKISPPHFSDYVRCVLLDKYGGTWIDASLYMLKPIPDFILKQSFFVLQTQKKECISNFFIRAAKNNYMIKIIRVFLEEYWKEEKFAIDYFFFHSGVILFAQKNKKCKKIYEEIIPLLNNQITFIVDNMAHDFDNDWWEYLKTTSFMYKLQRKNKKAIENKNSWYWYFINLDKYDKDTE